MRPPVEGEVEQEVLPTYKNGMLELPGLNCTHCRTCNHVKPDRAHHCSMCKRCILKMDHHCIWLNNCVGFRNYKLFVLAMFYGVLLALFTGGTLLQQLIYDTAMDSLFLNEVQFLIALVLSWVLGLAAGGLLAYHLYLSGRNTTTIEALDEEDRQRAVRRVKRRNVRPVTVEEEAGFNPYDLGSVWANLRAAFGQDPRYWLVPLVDDGNGNGLWFPRRQPPAAPPRPAAGPVGAEAV